MYKNVYLYNVGFFLCILIVRNGVASRYVCLFFVRKHRRFIYNLFDKYLYGLSFSRVSKATLQAVLVCFITHETIFIFLFTLPSMRVPFTAQ